MYLLEAAAISKDILYQHFCACHLLNAADDLISKISKTLRMFNSTMLYEDKVVLMLDAYITGHSPTNILSVFNFLELAKVRLYHSSSSPSLLIQRLQESRKNEINCPLHLCCICQRDYCQTQQIRQ